MDSRMASKTQSKWTTNYELQKDGTVVVSMTIKFTDDIGVKEDSVTNAEPSIATDSVINSNVESSDSNSAGIGVKRSKRQKKFPKKFNDFICYH